MTTITIERTILDRLIEALDSTVLPTHRDGMMQERMEDLRAELAKPVEPAGSNLAGQGAAIYKQLVHATNRLLSSQNEPERFGCVGPSPSDIEYRNLMQIFQHVCTGIDSPPTPAWHDAPEVAALKSEVERLKELADSEGARAVEYLRRVRKAEAEIEQLRKDAERLNFLDRNHRWKMGWVVGIAPLGNLSVTSVIQLSTKPTPIREAIDAAIAKAEGGAA